ncbi:MAG: malate synthase A, partial [Chloroflexi bacterium]|nr:malate synthase A [Chloroflexota bacterium]
MHDVTHATRSDIQLLSNHQAAFADILSPEALTFVAKLERTFRTTRQTLLRKRAERQARLDA